ncbi:MAG: glutathione S-transferase N-terminal domain-containing protein [Pseudomonadota bacterium]
MIKLYSWTTPNGRKVSIALEEMGLPYEAIPIDITKDAQFAPDFLAISPNNKIPAIVDGDQSVFESGAILLYLAHKTGQFLPPVGTSDHWDVMQWLMWQMGGFGPMVGQAHHFLHYNPGKLAYAEDRYHKETLRLYGVLEQHLAGRAFVAAELSIADFAIWPWAARFDYHKVDLNDFPNVKRWYLALADRPAFERGYRQPLDVGPIPRPA